jgi:aryl-alcohol dehydrogenase-like predicted oxidoreductase
MEKRAFGNTGLQGSPIGWAPWRSASWRQTRLHFCWIPHIDAGVTWIDTAPCYPDSEALLGRILPGRRERILLATKCGCTGPYTTHPHGFDRLTLLHNLDESLRCLGTDHLDLWQLHMQSSDTFPGGDAGELPQTMQEMQASGKVRHIGLSFKNGGPEDPLYPAEHGFRSMRRFGSLLPFQSVQLVYGALTRTSEKAIEAVARTGKAVIARGWLKKIQSGV